MEVAWGMMICRVKDEKKMASGEFKGEFTSVARKKLVRLDRWVYKW